MSIKQNVNNQAHKPPKAGPLQNVKVLFSAVETAGPFGPHLMAEWGADVIWIESVRGIGDTNRNYLQAEHEHRNDRSLSLNIFTEEGMEIFKSLIKEVDIFLVGGKVQALHERELRMSSCGQSIRSLLLPVFPVMDKKGIRIISTELATMELHRRSADL